MIRLIAIVDTKLGMAKSGQQMVALPDDEAYFGKQTKKYGGNVLMGQRTFAVIGHTLPDRHNFVASHSPLPVGVTAVADAVDFAQNFTENLWVIGGASIFGQTIDLADELYLTHVEANYQCDQFFPALNGFELKQRSDMQHQNNVDFYYAVYSRRAL
jgi:dihydrofolate reductase